MTRIGWLLALAGLAGAVAQVIPVAKTNPPVLGDIAAPPEVAAVLRRACYDCHSNETRWPWYSRVAPASWLVAHDVDHGRSELNFSEWRQYGSGRQARKRAKSAREVHKGDMPLWYYRMFHPEARLSGTERDFLAAWFEKPAPAAH